MAKRIGLLGGTFNPIHNQHLYIAEQVRVQKKLDEIWLLPTYQPQYKEITAKITDFDRVQMLKLAVEDNAYFKVLPYEIEHKSKYTYSTMKELTKLYPEVKFYFIIGADMVEFLPKWHKIEELFQLTDFIAVGRSGYSLETKYKIDCCQVLLSSLSSSFIRQQVYNGNSIKYLVPPQVNEYITKKGLYLDGV